MEHIKLSVVIICWNDLLQIGPCLRSIYTETNAIRFEVIVADNGSTDGSVDYVQQHFPGARIVSNGENLGFGPGNNAGILQSQGEYVLILNPDTIVHDRAFEKLVAYADSHPEAGAFGCRVLNMDGSFQGTAQPAPTVFGYLLRALYLRFPGRWSDAFASDQYVSWDGRSERQIGFQAGCCLLVRTPLLKALGGFDKRFLHQFEDADLCRRVWNSGSAVLFCPEAEITHIGGCNRGRYPIKVVLETQRSKYKYFHKHYGAEGVCRIRWISLIDSGIRYAGYSLLGLLSRSDALKNRLNMYHTLIKWHWAVNPVRFVEVGEEPNVGPGPLFSPPKTSAPATASPRS